jgi:flagellar hook-associated protein 3 FlgL
MRISTESIYDQQISAIDTLVAQQSLYAQQLSTGQDVTKPGDDPSQIAQLMAVQTDIGVQTQVGTDLSNLNSELSTVDSALGSVTNIMQQARSLAVQAASDTNSPTQLQEIGIQVNQLLQEAVGLANTQYGGRYVFAGTAAPSSQPVTLNGSPASVVDFTGNIDAPVMHLPNGESVSAGVTLQQAFNYDAPDGSLSVFQVLQNLYNALSTTAVSDVSQVQVNTAGASIAMNTALLNLSTKGAGYAATPLANGGNVSISIASGTDPNGTTIAFTSSDTISSMINKINAQTAITGVAAAFDPNSERITLSGRGPFQVSDVAGNFVETFNLQTQADKVNELSTQLGDFDHTTQVLLDARTVVGATVQQVSALSGSSASQLNNDQTVQSNIQDTNVAKTDSQLQLTQTALEAAYATTTKIEQKDLFDYLT